MTRNFIDLALRRLAAAHGFPALGEVVVPGGQISSTDPDQEEFLGDDIELAVQEIAGRPVDEAVDMFRALQPKFRNAALQSVADAELRAQFRA